MRAFRCAFTRGKWHLYFILSHIQGHYETVFAYKRRKKGIYNDSAGTFSIGNVFQICEMTSIFGIQYNLIFPACNRQFLRPPPNLLSISGNPSPANQWQISRRAAFGSCITLRRNGRGKLLIIRITPGVPPDMEKWITAFQ